MTLHEFRSERETVRAPVGSRFPPAEPLALSCPRCNLVIYPRVAAIAPQHCPRCLARHRLGVALQREDAS